MKDRSIYLEHLLRNIYQNKCVDLLKKGKSDIEPINIEIKIDEWYSELIEMVKAHKPDYYV